MNEVITFLTNLLSENYQFSSGQLFNMKTMLDNGEKRHKFLESMQKNPRQLDELLNENGEQVEKKSQHDKEKSEESGNNKTDNISKSIELEREMENIMPE